MKKICFLTTLIGDDINKLDKIGDFDKFNLEYYDFLLFTNIKNFIHKSWNIIYIDDEYLNKAINVDTYKNNRSYDIYKSRYVKFMGWKLLEKKYDVIFYCDCILSPNKNINWDKIANDILDADCGILQKQHPNKNNPYKECEAIVNCRKDIKSNMNNMKLFLKENNIPDNYIITENTSFGYDPNNIKILNAFTEFWKIYINKKITYRDQPLWGMISYKYNIKPIFNENLHKTLSDDKKLCFYFSGTSFNKNRVYL
jgi:hypothetical protein